MSILVDYQIAYLIRRGKLRGFDEDLINPASVDVRLGEFFTITKPARGYTTINPLNKDSFVNVTMKRGVFHLPPNGFILGCLDKEIELPNNIVGELVGKSSLGRLGLDNSSVAGYFDPGFKGSITIELKNIGHETIELTPGMPIGQVKFTKTKRCRKCYKLRGRYNNQKFGQGSLGV